MELSPGIHRIEGAGGANSFLVLSDEGAAVIDSGLPGNEKKKVEYARKAGLQSEQIRFLVLTHPDIDHSGSAAKLKALTGAKIAIHEADAPPLRGEEAQGGEGRDGPPRGSDGHFHALHPGEARPAPEGLRQTL